MTIRMTLTAVTLGTMALAGCSSMNPVDTMTTPAVVAPAMTSDASMAANGDMVNMKDDSMNASSVMETGDELFSGKDGMSAAKEGATMTAINPVMAAPAVSVAAPAMTMPTVTAAPVITAPAVTVAAPAMTMPAMTMPATTTAAGATMMSDDVSMAANGDMVNMKDDSMNASSVMETANELFSGKDDMSTAKESASMGSMSADDAVMNACFQAGGQVVSWVGDSSGATQACRREDGLEYRLADAQYYQ